MVARGDEKNNRTVAPRRAFTLIEALLVCALLALLAAPATVSVARLAGRFSDPYSPYNIEREVRDTAEWIKGVMRRALLERRDFAFEIYGTAPNPRIRAIWPTPLETVEWRSDRIAYRVNRTDTIMPEQFHYSHRYQTMSPAFALDVFAQTPEHGVTKQTEWGIVVSLYGLVRISRQGR